MFLVLFTDHNLSGRSQFSSVQSLSHVWLFATPWTASLSIISSQSLLKLLSIESVTPSNHLILCHPLLPPSIFPTIRVFSNESVLHIRWPKHWSFSFSISPSNEYSGLISFRIDWLDLLAVQLSHPHMTTGKNIALTRQTFVDKVMSLLFTTLSRLVITFFPRSKRLNFMAAVTICSDFGAKESLPLFPVFPHLLAMKWLDQMPWS